LGNSKESKPVAVKSIDVPPRIKQSTYPEPFRSRMNNRIKAQLGEFFGIKNFGINLTRLYPGGESALLHKHSKQDEFIYILEGEATLVTEDGEHVLTSGMCAGFPANGTAHQLLNRSSKDVLYLEVGDRTPNDEATYPKDDLKASMNPNGTWTFTHKDGTPYDV
jgi:uncharacterized cupin superfamily protein